MTKPETIDSYQFPFRLSSNLKEFKINENLLIRNMDDNDRERIFGITNTTFGENGLLTEYNSKQLSSYEDGVLFMNKHHLKSSNYILITSESNSAEEFNLALKLLELSSTSLYIGYGDPIPCRIIMKNCFYDLNLPALTVAQAEVDKVTKLVAQINANKTRKFNLISEIYINAMSDKIRSESRFLELSIILEILLLPGVSSELSYRFSLRLAKFINKHYSIPTNEVFKEGKKIYAIRSSIVHSGDNKDKDVVSMTKLLHEYVHKLLWKYLEDEDLFSEESLEKLCLE
ncbi:hypothetical protein W03_16610 [Nitrosomonas sp. PY1]|uniref:HEPN domain-containing protein n=1 Tax=Nitrosomonas sp. PY1 TaxID=1803906 RepID=UPI001FC8A674|nr:HEPN domain-containing protein [Nitrosomonas sp. PY1]GKS69657.1 hypothetical protein W03_16610 [Nitrosomonas sp. PY1]